MKWKINFNQFVVDAIDFHAPVAIGNLVIVTGRLCFTSAKSLEIEVFVDSQDLVQGKIQLESSVSEPFFLMLNYFCAKCFKVLLFISGFYDVKMHMK